MNIGWKKLWLKNRKFVLMKIKGYYSLIEALEDLEHQDCVVLITAAMKYWPDKDVKPIPYSDMTMPAMAESECQPT